MKRLIFALLLTGLLAVLSGCTTSYRVLNVDDHPTGEVTYMQTLTTKNMAGGLWNHTVTNYWECQRDASGLTCNKTCWNYDQFGSWPASAPEEGPRCAAYSGGAVVE